MPFNPTSEIKNPGSQPCLQAVTLSKSLHPPTPSSFIHITGIFQRPPPRTKHNETVLLIGSTGCSESFHLQGGMNDEARVTGVAWDLEADWEVWQALIK